MLRRNLEHAHLGAAEPSQDTEVSLGTAGQRDAINDRPTDSDDDFQDADASTATTNSPDLERTLALEHAQTDAPEEV